MNTQVTWWWKPNICRLFTCYIKHTDLIVDQYVPDSIHFILYYITVLNLRQRLLHSWWTCNVDQLLNLLHQTTHTAYFLKAKNSGFLISTITFMFMLQTRNNKVWNLSSTQQTLITKILCIIGISHKTFITHKKIDGPFIKWDNQRIALYTSLI